MGESEDRNFWLIRIIGAIVVTVVTFLSLCFWDTFGLGVPVAVAVSLVVGVLFLIFGGSIGKWVEEIYWWS